MAQLIQAFNANQFEPKQGGSGGLPVGPKQLVVIVDSQIKQNSAGNGGFIEYTLQLQDGQSKGATGVLRLNLYNASPKAVEIANQQQSALCYAVGVLNVTDTSVLHNIPFRVDVEPQKEKPDYTEVKHIYDANGNEPGPGNQAQGMGQQQQQGGNAWGGGQQQQQQQPQNQPQGGGWGNQGNVQQQPNQSQQQPQTSGWGNQGQQQQQQQDNAWGNQQAGMQQQQGGQVGGAPWGNR